MVNGVRGRINQTKPMEVTAVVSHPDGQAKNEAPAYLNFSNNETLLQDFDITYTNDVSAMNTHIALKDLTVHPRSFDLRTSVIAIKRH
jgi:hypothetical protein